jgi:preprotein translocase subunit YajC
MEPLIVLAVTFVLLWVLFILPQQRRVRAHQALVASIQPGDQVILSAGIYGRIVDLGPEEMTLEVAPGVELRVARQAVLRVVEDATAIDTDAGATHEPDDTAAGATDEPDATAAGATDEPDATASGATDEPDAAADAGTDVPGVSDPDNRGPAGPGPSV